MQSSESINSLSVLVAGRGHRLEMESCFAEPSSGLASVSGRHCLGHWEVRLMTKKCPELTLENTENTQHVMFRKVKHQKVCFQTDPISVMTLCKSVQIYIAQSYPILCNFPN